MVILSTTFISEFDLFLFHQGNLFESYNMLGSHPFSLHGKQGVRFSVWAPHAKKIFVVGDFNNWNGKRYPMHMINESGVWACFIPDLPSGSLYKYEIHTESGSILLKSDPYAFYSELRPNTASKVYDINSYVWHDDSWQKQKQKQQHFQKPVLIYEVHLGSWKIHAHETYLTYRELAQHLVPYVVEMGYTHIELLPITEHPYDRSWGYQTTGYFSVTSRFGPPEDFMYFIDTCHQNNIGVFLDWVPSHFCKDDHGLRMFDGQPLYEYDDPRKAEKHEWGTLTFDFGKPEVISFLISNALFWLEKYHIDGLRVDAVSSMLYLNYGHSSEEKIVNEFGGEENLEAIEFIQKLNKTIFASYPSTFMMAEEATAWPLVTSPTYVGGLGFNYKWNMGWMNDMLRYMELDPIYRKWNHNLITFSFIYTFSENFILPLSHDEVVHGKKSLLNKMPGDYWQKFANLRLFFSYLIAHPGKKLIFMGGEFGQFDEWKDMTELDWQLLDYPSHKQMHRYTKELHHFYLAEPSLWELDHNPDGFEWVDPHNHEQSIIAFMRKAKGQNDFLLFVCNFTPIVRYDYHIGVPVKGTYSEVFNSDDEKFGGSNQIHHTDLHSEPTAWHNQPYRITIKVPPLSTVVFKLKALDINN
ncbi:1,4-alpha-glucan branching protein GlgB [Alkalihalobacillus sp. LMS39]|uniref:1,4-alpha-glucan branching protein GlgB n=1 Tax=Alkalihalobacillus sp. LMS39 TaxID=2924032 RepID=UPI001FB38864|nr:1,4-alpha-glucan branching protein GlgB [Alkalihalobacillus sp. LMS39]UOE95396.1 1,4-alpha-glucan branching protein GlgB [Alkalihalobacillus sp. LMS39]